MTHDAEALSKMMFRGPVRFYDGRKGMAQQDFVASDEPRFGYSWRREEYGDKGRQFYTVDGDEVADLTAAAEKLTAPPSPESKAEKLKAAHAEYERGPRIRGCYNALSEARCNVAAGPFGQLRASLQRSEHAWHVGINRYAEDERKAGREHPGWLYNVKSAAQETYRLMYILDVDKQHDTNLRCLLGVKCRECPILNRVEESLRAEQTSDRPFRREVTDADIDAAKIMTCLGHMLQAMPGAYMGEGMIRSQADREDDEAESKRWAEMAAYEDELNTSPPEHCPAHPQSGSVK